MIWESIVSRSFTTIVLASSKAGATYSQKVACGAYPIFVACDDPHSWLISLDVMGLIVSYTNTGTEKTLHILAYDNQYGRPSLRATTAADDICGAEDHHHGHEGWTGARYKTRWGKHWTQLYGCGTGLESQSRQQLCRQENNCSDKFPAMDDMYHQAAVWQFCQN